jgi:hypothetical protein
VKNPDLKDLNLNLDSIKDPVREFALDVWEDLGRTRLAPVAVGLALAFLVVTGVAMSPGGGPEVAESSPIIATAPVQDDVKFSVPQDKPLTMADVDLSAPRDPFRSLDSVTQSNQTLLAAGEQIIDSVMGTDSSTGGSSTGLSTSGSSSLMPLDDLSSTPATTPPTSGDPQGDFGDSPEPTDTPPVPATDYSYTADVQFGQVDDLHSYSTVQRLGLIPSRKMPLIMYLGVSTDHQTAVFMVDSRLSQGGEGTCVPRDSLCTFLELQANPAHDEHHFKDADGNEYLLRLRSLDRTTSSTGSLTGRDVSALSGTPPVVDGER